jgi:hypothetical protein
MNIAVATGMIVMIPSASPIQSWTIATSNLYEWREKNVSPEPPL